MRHASARKAADPSLATVALPETATEPPMVARIERLVKAQKARSGRTARVQVPVQLP